MDLYIDQGGGSVRQLDGTYDHRAPFRPWATVERETAALYIVTTLSGRKVRIRKSDMRTDQPMRRQLYTDAQVDDIVWVREYRSALHRGMETADVATLKKVAELLGVWKP